MDFELLSKIYINLLDQKEPTLDFNTINKDINNLDEKEEIDYFKKVIIPNSEEIQIHKKYLKNSLKKNNF